VLKLEGAGGRMLVVGRGHGVSCASGVCRVCGVLWQWCGLKINSIYTTLSLNVSPIISVFFYNPLTLINTPF
jgi:hypothetical protein